MYSSMAWRWSLELIWEENFVQIAFRQVNVDAGGDDHVVHRGSAGKLFPGVGDSQDVVVGNVRVEVVVLVGGVPHDHQVADLVSGAAEGSSCGAGVGSSGYGKEWRAAFRGGNRPQRCWSRRRSPGWSGSWKRCRRPPPVWRSSPSRQRQWPPQWPPEAPAPEWGTEAGRFFSVAPCLNGPAADVQVLLFLAGRRTGSPYRPVLGTVPGVPGGAGTVVRVIVGFPRGIAPGGRGIARVPGGAAPARGIPGRRCPPGGVVVCHVNHPFSNPYSPVKGASGISSPCSTVPVMITVLMP